jgi:hypothetical protein
VSVSSSQGSTQVLIVGNAMNRAVDSDKVAVEILPREQVSTVLLP